eukprot:6468989-Pyramimonas_sp.AAC.1
MTNYGNSGGKKGNYRKGKGKGRSSSSKGYRKGKNNSKGFRSGRNKGKGYRYRSGGTFLLEDGPADVDHEYHYDEDDGDITSWYEGDGVYGMCQQSTGDT